ncbi:hypothetical protein [Cellulomonas taurus]|uniref:hypothetical protein n=1 Tax=Cellulomonas taurus TaxID=2729175 RepID=UPI00145D7A68|nr:hypothetical protein [Cellulomonas taurus]
MSTDQTTPTDKNRASALTDAEVADRQPRLGGDKACSNPACPLRYAHRGPCAPTIDQPTPRVGDAYAAFKALRDHVFTASEGTDLSRAGVDDVTQHLWDAGYRPRPDAPHPAPEDGDAVERAARAWSDYPLVCDGYEPMSDPGWRDYWGSPVSDRLRARIAAMLAAAGLLATAEPTVVRVHYGDSEAHARSFNEGFETAVAQSLADDPALAQEWLAEHDAQVRRDACDALQQLRGGDIEQEYIDHVVTGCES